MYLGRLTDSPICFHFLGMEVEQGTMSELAISPLATYINTKLTSMAYWKPNTIE